MPRRGGVDGRGALGVPRRESVRIRVCCAEWMAPRGEGSARGSVGRYIWVGRPIYIFHARRENVDGAGRNVCRGERVFEWGGANVSARYESLSRSVG